MSNNKIVRTICYFTDNPSEEATDKLAAAAKILEDKGYLIQTKRVCSSLKDIDELSRKIGDKVDYLSVGTLTYEQALERLPKFYEKNNLNFNIELSDVKIDNKYAELLFRIIQKKPGNTFSFSFVFNNAPSSPFFPSGSFEKKRVFYWTATNRSI